ncbi:MAG TPA: GAF domain-containing sensor histidine kinase, partial [Elusimicrobiota bacterium]|nr:GAF domain-containing sensor histidine kinase [Elusimicrobiota bacterium]
MSSAALAPVLAALLLAAVAAAAAWWTFVFASRLPLERALREKEAELDAARRLAAALLDAQALARRPQQALAEAAGRALDALHGLHPDLALAAAARRPDGSAVLLAHRGGAWARVPLPSLRLDAGFLARAAAEGEAEWTLGRGVAAGEDSLAAALADLGFTAAVAYGWTSDEGAGALIAAQAEPGDALARARPSLTMAAAALSSAAALADGIARMSETRERLQGGLSAAMEELTQTHDRLIRKSKEVKTLHDVAQAMVTRVGRDISSLGAIVAIVARALDADLVAFLILDEATGELVTQPGAFGLEGEELLYRIPLTETRSSSVRVFKTRKPFMSEDAQNDPGVIGSYAQLWKVHSLLVVPLLVEDRVLGVMRVGSRRRGAFGGDALALVTVVAEEASILVETAMLNRRLAETAEQLAALNRMKDEFVSTVSHEFKTPLTTITGFLSVMLDGETGPVNEQQVKFLQIAKAAAKRLAGLVSDLLDLSRLEGGAKMELRPLDLVDLIGQSVENHQPAAAEGGKSLQWAPPARLSKAVGDQRWLGLVLDNLVSNALKFTRPGGKVTVEAGDKG